MAVQFILGRAGSGKTHLCLESIRHELALSPRGTPLVLLVPEQATYQAERALVTTPNLGGYCRAFVLSFRRLAHQVFLDSGGPGLPPIEAAGKQMILRSILKRRAADLRLFDKSARQQGFVERLAATLAEFRAYGQWGDRLRAEQALLEAHGEGGSALAAKLHDLAIVVEEYERFLTERYVDPDSYLDLLPRRLEEKNRFHDARVWVDGFASFTGQEERVLGTLMRIAADMKIALCLDLRASTTPAAPREAADLSMFSLLRDTHDRLRGLAEANGQTIWSPLALPRENQPTRFSKAPALEHLENRVFAIDKEKEPPPANGSVSVLAAADRRSEVREVAAEILRLCREEGYRFREMAVIARDLEPYRALIETIFTDYEIPHFLDVRRDVAHHPLIEAIRAALAVVARGWRTAGVLRFAKSDLAPLDRLAVDRLENVALAHGVEGELWYDDRPWTFTRRLSLGEDREKPGAKTAAEDADRRRRELVKPLRAFETAIGGRQAAVRAISQALFDLLEELDVAGRLEEWAAEDETAGRLDSADEHRQVWGAVVDLLDQVVAALGDDAVDLDEYREIVEAGLAAIRLRLVPPALDQVLVGSVERSRHPEIRAAFVLGMNERLFPLPQTPDVVFGDSERERLAADGLRLGPVSEKRMLHERFLAYIAFTRPSERLFVSSSKADPLGKSLQPSFFLDDLRKCFSDLDERGEPVESPERAPHWRAALSGLVAACRRGAGETGTARNTLAAVYEAIRRDGQWTEPLARRVGGLVYKNEAAALGSRLSLRLYGERGESSVSRLECFAACPFKHFARYGLGLEERDRFQLERVDLGTLYHEVLNRVYHQLAGNGPLDWGEVDPGLAIDAVHEAIDRLAPELRNEIMLATAHNRYLLGAARRALEQLVRVMIETGRRDGFRQVAAEYDFGGETRLGPLEIEFGDGRRLRLRGRIDRIDRSADGRNIVRVIDYKSRSRRFRVVELAHGLALQLPAYLLALGCATQNRPQEKQPVLAGALFLPIHREVGSAAPAEAVRAEESEVEDLAGWRARGFFDLQWATLFDSSLEKGQSSPVVALRVTKAGKPYARSDAYEDDGVNVILEWTCKEIAELAERIFMGEVAVAPYELNRSTPCTWCEFRPVCRFDAQVEPYNRLANDLGLDWMREQIGG